MGPPQGSFGDLVAKCVRCRHESAHPQSVSDPMSQRAYLSLPSVLAAYRDPCLSYNVALKRKLSPLSDAQL